LISILNKNDSKIFFIFSLLFVFFVLSIFCTIPAKAKLYDPSLDWQVLESQHFSVVFPRESPIDTSFEYQQIAINVARIAEETYQQITPYFGEPFKEEQKIAIILEDFSDSVYGFASTIPHRSIRINLTAPGFKNFDTKFENWLKILLVHEYTHLAHFDMTSKGTTFLRIFLGQIIAPNALQPMWATEGIAIYNESKWSTGGRLKDNRYDMYLRSDFLGSQPKSLELLRGSYLTSWPGGSIPYIYGQSLVHYIVQKYGEDKLIAISEKFCAHPLLGMNWAIEKVLGINQDKLYENWQDEQYQYYQQQVEEVHQFSELTPSEQITNHQYWVDDPLWLSTSDNSTASLLYKVSNTGLYPTIREYNPASKEENILIHRTTGHGTSYTLSSDRRYLLYTKLSQYQQYYHYHDLFLYQLESGKQMQVSEGMRIKDPSWHPHHSQNKIVAVVNDAGNNNLVLFSFEQKFLDIFHEKSVSQIENNASKTNLISFSNLTYLTDFTDGTQISQPVWSPSGNQIAFSLWQNGYQDIYIIELDKNNQILSTKAITQDKFTDISPNWSPDEQYLFFSSDRSGIFNLYAYNLENKHFYRLTNVLTGVFEPAISPDGKELAFIQYHASGYELHLADIDQLLWQPVDLNHDETNQTENRPLFDSFEMKDYSPWDSLLPTYWTPYLTFTSNDLYLGFSSLAQDYLKFYNFPFKIAWGILNPSIYYDIQFINYAHKPVFSLSWQGETLLEDRQMNHFFDPEYTTSRFQAKVNFHSEGYTSQQDSARFFNENISLGFQNDLYNFNVENNDNTDSSFKKVNSLILRYSYSDTESYSASISPEIGSSFSLSYQHANKILGSQLTFNKILFDGRKYFPLPGQNHVMALRLVAGISTEGLNEKEQFHLGGHSNSSAMSSIHTSSFPLRGFSSSSFSGNNLLCSSLDYRFPIKTVEEKIGFDWASIFLERISGSLFLDAGHAWEGNFTPFYHKINASVGAELHFKFNSAHNSPFTFIVGAGKPVTEPSQFRFYFQTGISF
jgi:hypothetical protein